YWTWGQRDKSNQRFARYITLYGLSGLVNILSNELFLSIIPNIEMVFSFRAVSGSVNELMAIKADKFFAVVLAAGVTMVINFVGQKKWVFTQR
ncbi:MAG: GtrA family protein, partial [Bacteroidota bacterium]